MKERLKKWCIWILVAVFWIGVAATFIGGCAGMLFHSGDEQTYEEHFLDKVP
jgi:hypothetical protein